MAKSNSRNYKVYMPREMDNDPAKGMKKVLVPDSFVTVYDMKHYTNFVSPKSNDDRYASSSQLFQPEIPAKRSDLPISRFGSRDNLKSSRTHRSSTLSSSSPERFSLQNADMKGRPSFDNSYVEQVRSAPVTKPLDKSGSRKPPSSYLMPKSSHSGMRSSSLSDLSELNQTNRSIVSIKKNAVSVSNGIIQICSGDITKQTVDAVVIASTSNVLRDNVLKEAGDSIEKVYQIERRQQPDKSFSTQGGNLPCQRIYFIPFPKVAAEADQWAFRNFVKEAIRIATNDHSSNIQSLAFPAIGCGAVGCDPSFVAKTLILAVAYEFEHQSSLQFHVSFVIRSSQQDVFDSFSNELAALAKRKSTNMNSRPPRENSEFTVEKRPVDQLSHDYKMVMREFASTMTSKYYSTILRIELVWNRCWYQQYMIHKAKFSHRLKQDTERLLFHGCPESATDSIINGCFDRRYAGQNGTLYGEGSYFSSKASYSHSYTTPNSRGERCMFLAKVLVGKTTVGNSTMRVCPAGYDTTTDGSHIYVVYHDSQAFANYLITYK